MTINASVNVTGNAWVNLHSEAGVAVGDNLRLQDMMPDDKGIVAINSATEPTETSFADVGGGVAAVQYQVYLSEPEAGEVTWARRPSGSSGIVRVQA